MIASGAGYFAVNPAIHEDIYNIIFLDSLKTIPNLELALRCYGHQTFIKPERNCKDTKLEVPFATASKSKPSIGQVS